MALVLMLYGYSDAIEIGSIAGPLAGPRLLRRKYKSQWKP